MEEVRDQGDSSFLFSIPFLSYAIFRCTVFDGYNYRLRNPDPSCAQRVSPVIMVPLSSILGSALASPPEQTAWCSELEGTTNQAGSIM